MSKASARQKAEEILATLGITKYPIDPLIIARRYDFEVLAANFVDKSLAGTVSVDDGNVTIAVSANDIPTRRAFTIAHEIGHALLHLEGAYNGKFRDSQASLQRHSSGNGITVEVEANEFAANLLMPEHMIKIAHGSSRSIPELAEMFGVSSAAMKYRLKNLNVIQ